MSKGVSNHPGFEALVHHGVKSGRSKKSGDPIHIKSSHKGELHRDLGVPPGQPIPESKIKAAEHSKDPAVRKRAQFADNAKKFNH